MCIAFHKHYAVTHACPVGSHKDASMSPSATEDYLHWGRGLVAGTQCLELTNRRRGLVLTVAFGDEDANSRYTSASYDVCTTAVGVFFVCDAKSEEHYFFVGCSMVPAETMAGFCLWGGAGANIEDGSSLIIHWSSGSHKRSTNWANQYDTYYRNSIVCMVFSTRVPLPQTSLLHQHCGDTSMAYFTTIVTRIFDENDIFISLESSIHALQDGCSIFVGYKI